MMSEFVARYELGRQWWQGWHKGNKGAPPNTNPLGVGAKLRAAGAVRAQSSFWRSMPQRQRPRTMAVPHLVLERRGRRRYVHRRDANRCGQIQG
jgi:hypothetical protein